MHLPVFTLVSRRQQGLGGNMRVVTIFVGIILQDEAELTLKFSHQPFDDRTGRRTVRSLKIKKFNNGDRGIRWT